MKFGGINLEQPAGPFRLKLSRWQGIASTTDGRAPRIHRVDPGDLAFFPRAIAEYQRVAYFDRSVGTLPRILRHLPSVPIRGAVLDRYERMGRAARVATSTKKMIDRWGEQLGSE